MHLAPRAARELGGGERVGGGIVTPLPGLAFVGLPLTAGLAPAGGVALVAEALVAGALIFVAMSSPSRRSTCNLRAVDWSRVAPILFAQHCRLAVT